MWTNLWRTWKTWFAWQEVPFVASEANGAMTQASGAGTVLACAPQAPDWMVPAYMRRQRAAGDSIALARWQ